MSPPLPCLVSEDGQWAKVGQELLTAAQVEALTRELLAVRAAMLPRRFPVMFDGVPILLGDGFARTTDGQGRRLACVHLPGAGWTGAEEPSQSTTAPAVTVPRPGAARRPSEPR